jgi:hypothetical protein
MIRHYTVVDDPQLRNQLWEMAERVFVPICEETPINQFYPREMFEQFLVTEDIFKCVVFDGDIPCGFGLITERIEHEPILNPYYFRKKFPGVPTFLVMLICIDPQSRADLIGCELLRHVVSYVPQDGIAIFVHSDLHNGNIPRFGKFATRGRMDGEKVDAESCWIYRWIKPRGLPQRPCADLEETTVGEVALV